MRTPLALVVLTLIGGCKVSQDDVAGPGDSAADTDVLDTDVRADSDGDPTDTDARDSGGDTDAVDTDAVDTDATAGVDTDGVDTDALDTDPIDTDAPDTDLGDTDAAPFCGDGRIDPGEECDDIYNYFPGDGCTGCVVDAYWYCWGEPSYCVVL